MTEFRCNECDREFGSEQSLNDHNRSKHFSAPKKPLFSFIGKKFTFYFIVILILFSVGWLVMSLASATNDCKTADVTTLSINSHTGAKSHYHANLEIIVDGEKQNIPTGVGVLRDQMRPTHTHDSSGELHIEGPCVRDFTLGDFFKIYGKTFNSQCIFDNCDEEGKSSLKMFVNGDESVAFGDLVLRDGQKIKVEFSSSS